jgi:mono/diheme cytochrome c family protein
MGRASQTALTRVLHVTAFAAYVAASVSAVAAGQTPAVATSVWDGVFTSSQAERGRTVYAANCAQCHGADLQGGEGAALIADKFWLDWGERTVGELLTYVSKSMPFSEDGSLAGTLAAGTYADIIAHILSSNGFPSGKQELTIESAAAAQIVKKEGPGELPATTLAHVVGCLAPRAADGSWRLIRATPPRRVSSSASTPDRNAPLGDREYALKFVLTPLTKFVGHRMSVTGLLLGTGGTEGLNVSSVESVADTCS